MDKVAALEAQDLYRFYRAGGEETLALRGVSLTVAPGEVLAVVGPSGSGKSTLLSCLAGLDEPAGGRVLVGGEQLTHRPEADRARIRARRIGVLMQTRNLVAHLTVAQNIRLAQQLNLESGVLGREELLEGVGLRDRANAYASELSGGELARAGLAVALANTPDVLLADEPTGELDGAVETSILELLRARATAGTGLLIVTHSPTVVRVADSVIHLRDGQVAA